MPQICPYCYQRLNLAGVTHSPTEGNGQGRKTGKKVSPIASFVSDQSSFLNDHHYREGFVPCLSQLHLSSKAKQCKSCEKNSMGSLLMSSILFFSLCSKIVPAQNITKWLHYKTWQPLCFFIVAILFFTLCCILIVSRTTWEK